MWLIKSAGASQYACQPAPAYYCCQVSLPEILMMSLNVAYVCNIRKYSSELKDWQMSIAILI